MGAGTLRGIGAGLVGTSALLVMLVGRPAYADGALRRYEEPHRSSDSGSHSSSNSSSSSSGSDGGSILGAILNGLFSGSSCSTSGGGTTSTDDVEAPEVVQERYLAERRLAAVLYEDEEAATYIHPWRRDETGEVVPYRPRRRAEVHGGWFHALNEDVVSWNTGIDFFLGPLLIGGGFERFSEPNHAAQSTDILDDWRFRLGPNVVGGSISNVELYPMIGASILHGFGDTIPALDLSIEGRAYPMKPLAFFASGTASIFKDGPPILEGRMEGGVSLGRVDLRAGFRALRQNPEQSLVGPVASLTLRL